MCRTTRRRNLAASIQPAEHKSFAGVVRIPHIAGNYGSLSPSRPFQDGPWRLAPYRAKNAEPRPSPQLDTVPFHFNAHVGHIRIVTIESVIKRDHERLLAQCPTSRMGIVAGIGNGSWEKIQTGWWHQAFPNPCGCSAALTQFGTRPPDRPTKHIPNDEAIHPLFAPDDLGG